MKKIKQFYLNIKKSIIDFIFKLINFIILKIIIFINKIIIKFYNIKWKIISLLIIKINKIKGKYLKIKIIILFKIFSFLETLKNVYIKIKKLIIKIIKLYIKMILRSTLISWFIIYVYPYISIYIGDIYMFSIVGFMLAPHQPVLSPILEDGEIIEEDDSKERRRRRKYKNKALPMLPMNEILHSPPTNYREYNSPLLGELLVNNENLARNKFEIENNIWDHHFNQSLDWKNEPIYSPLMPSYSPTIENSFNRIDWTNCTLSDPMKDQDKSRWISRSNDPIIPNFSRFSYLTNSNQHEHYVQDTYGIRDYPNNYSIGNNNYKNWLDSASVEENKSVRKRLVKWIKKIFIRKNNNSQWWD